MKKFFYVAVMALTVAFMASCGGSGTSGYYANGKEPDVNYEEGTINGKKYDNVKEQCWKVQCTQTYIVTVTTDHYEWGTEFDAVLFGEALMWTDAQAGIKGKYSVSAAPSFTDSESCLANNTDE